MELSKDSFLYKERVASLRTLFPHLNYDFLQAMEDIGKLGEDKYGEDSFQARTKDGPCERWMPRVETDQIEEHTKYNFFAYSHGIEHDVFETLKHQLGAAAFNCMMEAILSGVLYDSETISRRAL